VIFLAAYGFAKSGMTCYGTIPEIRGGRITLKFPLKAISKSN
jgi:hypothetical protein